MSTTQILIMVVSGLALFIAGFIIGSMNQASRLIDAQMQIRFMQHLTEEKLRAVDALLISLKSKTSSDAK